MHPLENVVLVVGAILVVDDAMVREEHVQIFTQGSSALSMANIRWYRLRSTCSAVAHWADVQCLSLEHWAVRVVVPDTTS